MLAGCAVATNRIAKIARRYGMRRSSGQSKFLILILPIGLCLVAFVTRLAAEQKQRATLVFSEVSDATGLKFRRFKNAIHEMGVEKAWCEFKGRALEKIAIEWLEENKISYSEDDNAIDLTAVTM